MPQNLDRWRREFGQEQVDVGITHLLDHVAKCWQPSWYDFAGVLLPVDLHKGVHSSVPVPRNKEQFSTGNDSTTFPSLVISNVATSKVHSDVCMNPPLQLRSGLLSGPFSETKAQAHDPRGTCVSVVEEADGLRSPLTVRLGKQGSASSTELGGPLRPKRQARDKALAKIRQTQGQPKKRSRPSGSNLSPAAKRRKTPANRVNQFTAASVEVEEKLDKNEVENALGLHEEVIAPIEGTLIPWLKRSLTPLTSILIVPAQAKTVVSYEGHPSGEHKASVDEEALDNSSMEHAKRLPHCPFHDEALVLEGGTLDAVLRKQKALIREMALTQTHIQSLRDGLDNWVTLTEAARKMLGKYHTRDDILRTLSREEVNLDILKSYINCIEYRIEEFRQGENPSRNPVCIAEE